MQILTSITCTSGKQEERVAEADKYNLKEVGLFLTTLNPEDREKLYFHLDRSGIQQIPFVHIKTDCTAKELEYLTNVWGTEVFNIHSKRRYPLTEDLSEFKERIFVENSPGTVLLDEQEIAEYGGICLDYTHLDNCRITKPEVYAKYVQLLEKFPIGCGHVSAMKTTSFFDEEEDGPNYSYHAADSSENFEYLKRYAAVYKPKWINIELENPIGEQLEFKKAIEKNLGLA